MRVLSFFSYSDEKIHLILEIGQPLNFYLGYIRVIYAYQVVKTEGKGLFYVIHRFWNTIFLVLFLVLKMAFEEHLHEKYKYYKNMTQKPYIRRRTWSPPVLHDN